MTTITAPDTAQEKYNALSTRLDELRRELGTTNGQINGLLSIDNIGALVASGADYDKQTAKVAELRHKAEALGLGILYIEGQISLLERSHYGLNKR